MEMTTGWIITGIAVVGILICIICLLVADKIFKKQRKGLLHMIEME